MNAVVVAMPIAWGPSSDPLATVDICHQCDELLWVDRSSRPAVDQGAHLICVTHWDAPLAIVIRHRMRKAAAARRAAALS